MHIRHGKFWEFNKKAYYRNSYDQDDITNRNGFSKFRSGDTSLRDKIRQGRSSDLNQGALKDLAEYNLHKNTQDLSLDFNTSQSTICGNLKKIGKVTKLGVWLPRNLSEKNKENYMFIVFLFQGRKTNHLSRISLQAGKDGSFMTLFNTKGSGFMAK